MTITRNSAAKFILLIILGHASVRGQSPHTPDVEPLLWKGINAMYAYEYASADRLLDSAMVTDPSHPVPLFVSLANRWLWSLTEEGTAASHATLVTAIDEAIPRYEALLEADPDNAALLLYLGSTYGMNARIALSQKRWTTVVTSGIRGLRFIQRSHEIDSTLADAYLPLGIFDYYAGISSRPVRLLSRLVGIHADKVIGIQELDRAVRTANYAWIEAASTLALLHTYIEDDPQSAQPYVDSLVVHFPKSFYFNFLRGDVLLRLGQFNDLEVMLPNLEAMIETSHEGQRREWRLKYSNILAGVALNNGDLIEARRLCNWVIENYEMEFDWHLGFAIYTRGQVSEREGKIESAASDYRSAMSLDNQTYIVAKATDNLARLREGK